MAVPHPILSLWLTGTKERSGSTTIHKYHCPRAVVTRRELFLPHEGRNTAPDTQS